MRARAEAELAPPGRGLGGVRERRRVQRAARLPPGQADAPGRGDRVRPHGRGGSRDGVSLTITSGFRRDAEQAVLFARHPDPKWVAPPGQSLHRLATELDLGPPGLQLAGRERKALPLHAALRWEPWHSDTLEPALVSARRRVEGARAARPAGCPTSCPPASRPRSTRRRSDGACPRRCSPRSSMPRGASTRSRSALRARGDRAVHAGHRRGIGLGDPFDPEAAINAQAHLMRDLLRRFAAVPLALAAYNAGPAPSRRAAASRRTRRPAATSRASSA